MLLAERAVPRGRTAPSSLNGAQRRVLSALVDLCPGPGQEAPGARVALEAGMTPGPAKLALGALRTRRLVDSFDEGGDAWAPTFTGRAEARVLTRA